MKHGIVQLDEIADFDTVIDVRSPGEFAEDHIPGAINCPVLDDAQRAEVGTIYKQVSPFEARKIGAALIAENIGHHLRTLFLDRPKQWRPFVYCWRGGMRSGAMVTILRSVGWNAGQLEGGYKAYRQDVVSRLETLPGQFRFQVLGGATGSAKTRILQALGRQGAQILDLETLACHKGSVLGILPGTPQPTQKWFETELLACLQHLDPDRPVYVEAESRKIGNLHVPEALIRAIRGGSMVAIEATLPARVEFLLRDYDYFLADPAWLKQRLSSLRGLQSNETLTAWGELADAGRWTELVTALLEQHYDPLYRRSQDSNYAGMQNPRRLSVADLSDAGIEQAAATILQG